MLVVMCWLRGGYVEVVVVIKRRYGTVDGGCFMRRNKLVLNFKQNQ